MSFDHEAGRFNDTQHELLSAQMLSTVMGMQPNQVGYVDYSQAVSDESGKTWLKAYGRVYDLNEVIEVGVRQEETNFARVVCTEDGFILDKSHANIKIWNDDSKVKPISSAIIKEHPHEYIPVTYAAFNREEWELVLPAIRKQYGIGLEIENLSPAIEEIKRLLAEAKSEEYAADDDEEAA